MRLWIEPTIASELPPWQHRSQHLGHIIETGFIWSQYVATAFICARGVEDTVELALTAARMVAQTFEASERLFAEEMGKKMRKN
jgi:hypothetical protein